jgi:hypothetical protein
MKMPYFEIPASKQRICRVGETVNVLSFPYTYFHKIGQKWRNSALAQNEHFRYCYDLL